ncbi:hypothetical protein Hanom_Chr06g00485561 [Helianthus anomalus]
MKILPLYPFTCVSVFGVCLNCLVLCARLDAKLPSSQGSHWKQPHYSYGVEVRLSTSYPPQTLA